MSNPHDAFFKSLFSDTAELISLLRDLLHPEVVRQLDLDGLKPLPTEVVRASLNLGLSDLRFSVPWRVGGTSPYACSWSTSPRPTRRCRSAPYATS
jgi:hypothetical protein